MKKYADMVRGTTTTEGTGTLTLGATPDGFIGFADVLANSDECSILIVDNPNAPAQWELCESVFSSGTLTRGRILASSTGSRVDFDPGTKIVQLVATSDDYRTIAENLDSNLVLGGAAGAYTIESQRDVEPYEGLSFVAVVNHTNPAEPTLVWNDEDPVAILGPDGEVPPPGYLIQGRTCSFRFDGAAWRVIAGTAVSRTNISPKMFGAAGDGETDDLAALEACVAFAAHWADIAGPFVTIDLSDGLYALSGSLSFDGVSNVIVRGGGVKAIAGTWNPANEDNAIFHVEHSGDYYGLQNLTFEDIFVDGNGLAGGWWCANTFNVRIAENRIVRDLFIVRTSKNSDAKNGDLRMLFNESEHFQFPDSVTSVPPGPGFHIRSYDYYLIGNTVTRHYPDMLLEDQFGGGVITSNHFYNGYLQVGAGIASIANNGSGLCRVTTNEAHGLTSGVRVWIAEVTGTTEANGFWTIDVVDTDTFDLRDTSFSNAYVSGGLVRHVFPAAHIICDPTGANVETLEIQGNYFDGSAVIIDNPSSQMIGNNRFHTTFSSLVLRTDQAAWTALGLAFSGTNAGTLKFETLPGGSWSPDLRIVGAGFITRAGGLGPGVTRQSLRRGSAGLPAIVFGSPSGNDSVGLWSPEANSLAYGADGVWRVDPNGKEILGHTTSLSSGPSAQTKQQVYGTDGNAGATYGRFSNNSGPPNLQLGKSRSASAGAARSAVQSNDVLGRYGFFGDDGTDLNNVGAYIEAVASQNWTDSAQGTRLQFVTTKAGEAAAALRFYIGADGNLYPGATNTYDLGGAAATVKDIYTQNAVTVVSDERAKVDVRDCPLGLEFILALRPVTARIRDGEVRHSAAIVEPAKRISEAVYDEAGVIIEPEVWSDPVIEERIEVTREGRRRHAMLLAQQVRSAMDDLGVSPDEFAGWCLADPEDPESRQMLRYEEFIAPLISSIHQLFARVKELEDGQ